MVGLEERVQAALVGLVDQGTETGLQVTVIHRGQTIVNATAGCTDSGGGSPVAADTLFYAASAAKGIASAVAHVLVERGLVSYELRVADVWPEFGVHGKDHVTLRDVLLHTAGVPALPADTTAADLADWDHTCAVIAAARPSWPPGTRMGYHALTFGYLLGETLRRATGRTLPELLRDEISGPLGVADEVHFGIPRRLLARVARQVPGTDPLPAPEPGSLLAAALPAAVRPSADFANRPDILAADIPSFGTMTARGAARVYAALLGDVPGVDLVPATRRALMATPAYSGPDEVAGFDTTWAYGYSPDRPGGVPSRRGSTFGMVGANGCAAYADIDSGVAVAVMRNRFVPTDLAAVTAVDRIVAETCPS